MTKQSVATCALAAFMLCIAAFAEAKGKVIYTGEIAKKVQGYAGTTPLNITIEDGIITKIEALPCNETPKYYKRAQKAIFPQYIGKTVSQALKIKPDAATGATYSSKALISNIKIGLNNYKQSAKKK